MNSWGIAIWVAEGAGCSFDTQNKWRHDLCDIVVFKKILNQYFVLWSNCVVKLSQLLSINAMKYMTMNYE